MDELALQIGYTVIGGAFLYGWFVSGVKAAESGREVLAWIIGLTPPILVVIGIVRSVIQ